MITLNIMFIVYIVSIVYLNYDIRKTNDCSLWEFLTDYENFPTKDKLFPLLILIITLPILALWAFTDNKKGN